MNKFSSKDLIALRMQIGEISEDLYTDCRGALFDNNAAIFVSGLSLLFSFPLSIGFLFSGMFASAAAVFAFSILCFFIFLRSIYKRNYLQLVIVSYQQKHAIDEMLNPKA